MVVQINNSIYICLVLLAVNLMNVGCVPIPFPADIDSIDFVAPEYGVQMASRITHAEVVRTDQHGVVDQFIREVQERNSQVEVFDSSVFWQEAFPDRSIDMDILFGEFYKDNAMKIIAKYNIRFIVLLSPTDTDTSMNDMGGYIFGSSGTEMTSFFAFLIDMYESATPDYYLVEATGDGWAAWIPAPYIGFTFPYADPDTVHGAVEAMAAMILERVLVKTDGKATRIMVNHINKEGLREYDDSVMQRYWNTVAMDRSSAHQILCRSADAGNLYARFRLGQLYEKGAEDLPKDRVKSIIWYRLSAISDHPWGTANANRQSESATDSELDEVDRLLKEWRPGQCVRDLDYVDPEYN